MQIGLAFGHSRHCHRTGQLVCGHSSRGMPGRQEARPRCCACLLWLLVSRVTLPTARLAGAATVGVCSNAGRQGQGDEGGLPASIPWLSGLQPLLPHPLRMEVLRLPPSYLIGCSQRQTSKQASEWAHWQAGSWLCFMLLGHLAAELAWEMGVGGGGGCANMFPVQNKTVMSSNRFKHGLAMGFLLLYWPSLAFPH